jgi:hypothetical protein
MARIQYGPIIGNISGSVGSATFQKSLYGNTLRNRPRNSRAGTAAQFTARNLMMQCQYAWRQLSEADRRQWNQFISFSGQSINRDRGILTTGHSLFLKYNFARLQAGLAIVSTIVYKSAPAWPDMSSVNYDDPGVHIIFSDDLEALDIYPIVFLSPIRPESRSFSKEGLRFMKISLRDQASIWLGTSYVDTFGVDIEPDCFYSAKWQFFHCTSPLLSSVFSAVFEIQII